MEEGGEWGKEEERERKDSVRKNNKKSNAILKCLTKVELV